MNMFEQASKTKLRIATPSGLISVEDLWDLPLEGKRLSLDSIAIELNKKLTDSSNQSFVSKKSTVDTEVALAFEIVKHIIEVKVKERDERLAAAEKKVVKEKVLQALAQKREQSLNEKSEEELLEMLKQL